MSYKMFFILFIIIGISFIFYNAYTKTLMEKTSLQQSHTVDFDDANDALNIASDIWNYTITLEKGNIDESSKQNIVRQIETILGMSKDKAAVLFDKMIERKRNLLPEDIQPKASRYMFRIISNLVVVK